MWLCSEIKNVQIHISYFVQSITEPLILISNPILLVIIDVVTEKDAVLLIYNINKVKDEKNY